MKDKEENANNQEISKEIGSSLEILILYRSLYIIKQKFGLFKERIKKVYDKFNIYKDNYNLGTDLKIYQIDKKNFVQVVDEVLKDINILIIKYANPKDIFISKLLLKDKINETLSVIPDILNWLINNKDGKFSIKHYNKIFFNKKIKRLLKEEEVELITEPDNVNGNEANDFTKNLSKKNYVNLCEYNRKGKKISTNEAKILDEDEKPGEGVITTIDTMNTKKIINGDENNGKEITNKELTINFNDIKDSSIDNKKRNIQIKINNDFIFIESLPLILADFLEQHLSYAIVETEDELGKELKVLFDSELLRRIKEFSNILKDKASILNDISGINILTKEEKRKKDLEHAVEDLKKIKNNIKIYKDILENKKKLNENFGYIEKMIEKLLAKEIWLEHRIKLLYEKDQNNFTNNNLITTNIGRVTGNTDTSNISSSFGNLDSNKIITHSKKNILYNNTNKQLLNESISNSINTGIINDKSNNISVTSNSTSMKINNALQDIFIYYSKLHQIAGYTPLFSNVEQKQFHLDLHEFSKFCIDFKIPILRQKIVEVFKKSTSNLHNMTFKEFKNSVINLANTVHESKKKTITQKIINKKNELNSLELKEKQNKEERKFKRLLYNNNNDNSNIENDNNNNEIINNNKTRSVNKQRSKNKNAKNNKSRSSSSNVNVMLQKKTLFNDIANFKINYNKEKNKNYQEIVDEFYEFLGLYSKQDYRSKMRGYKMSSVKTNLNTSNINNSQEKSFMTGAGNRSKSFRREEIEEINKVLENNKNDRIKKQLLDKEKKKLLLYKEKLKLFNINNQRLKITSVKKMKKKTYLDLMREEKDEKNEILYRHQLEEQYLKNKLKEKELKKSKSKEKLKKNNENNSVHYKNEEDFKEVENKGKDVTIIEEKSKINLDNMNNNDEKEISAIHANDIKEEKEEKKKRVDKYQIWWEKLEKYDINELGMDEEEKDIFNNSDNSEENLLASKVAKSKISSNNSGLISDTSMHKNISIIENNSNNGPIQLPPLNYSKKSNLKNKNEVIELPSFNDNNIKNKNQNQRTGINEIQSRIKYGNNNNTTIDNERYKILTKNNSSKLFGKKK